MKFRVSCQKTSSGAHSPIQVVEQSTGKGVTWINRYLDREYVRRLANKSLYSYGHSLLHFVRWWESIHHTGEISAADLTESTLFDYLRSQSSRQPPPPQAYGTGTPQVRTQQVARQGTQAQHRSSLRR